MPASGALAGVIHPLGVAGIGRFYTAAAEPPATAHSSVVSRKSVEMFWLLVRPSRLTRSE
jgi:hypothetical protein